MLLFLSYLVKAPARPRRPTWLPAPIVILAHAASNALHAASPSSGRTRSRSHSSSFGRISGLQSKGTPTSAHSFGSAGVRSAGMGSGSSCSGESGNRLHHHSRSGAHGSTPSSYRSRGASAGLEVLDEVNMLRAGQHLPVDADAAVEYGVAEPPHDDEDGSHK